jgi:membrane-associated phospholipid phosphatase
MCSNRSRLRVEDVLTLSVVAAMLLFARSRAALSQTTIDEGHFWELSFILLPASALVFMTSAAYAFGGPDDKPLAPTLNRIIGVLRDWLPFALFLLFYEAFRSRIWGAILGADRDVDLLRIDRMLLGETPAITMQRIVTPWLTNLMVIAYFLHLVLPPLLATSLYRKDLLLFRRFLLSVFLAGAIGSAGYIAVPATGPSIAFPGLFRVTLGGDLEKPVLRMLDAARAPRDVFPSLHVAVSAIVLWFAAKSSRKWFWWLLPFVLANWISTMYLRYHYFADVVAGWLCAAVAIAAAQILLRIERRISLLTAAGSR